MPDIAVVARPISDRVKMPGVHRRAVAIDAPHADLLSLLGVDVTGAGAVEEAVALPGVYLPGIEIVSHIGPEPGILGSRSEEHTSELQSLMRISYAVFCLKQKKQT